MTPVVRSDLGATEVPTGWSDTDVGSWSIVDDRPQGRHRPFAFDGIGAAEPATCVTSAGRKPVGAVRGRIPADGNVVAITVESREAAARGAGSRHETDR